ncbi:hypothetical protein KIPB_015868, partial [Kipferlia bialata]|eukprot:g15868.t1
MTGDGVNYITDFDRVIDADCEAGAASGGGLLSTDVSLANKGMFGSLFREVGKNMLA